MLGIRFAGVLASETFQCWVMWNTKPPALLIGRVIRHSGYRLAMLPSKANNLFMFKDLMFFSNKSIDLAWLATDLLIPSTTR